MCNNESHTGLSNPEHFSRHIFVVERVRNLAEAGIRGVTIDEAFGDAREAMKLKDAGTSKESVAMLEGIVALEARAVAS